MTWRAPLVLLVVLAIACGPSVPETAPATAEPSSPPVAATAEPAAPSDAEIDARDQYTLLTAIEAAEAMDEDAMGAELAAVREAWEGRRYRWDVMRVDGLCTSGERCLVAPFDLGRFDHAIHASFLPVVQMSEAEHARMGESCAPHAPECIVTVEATLEVLELSDGVPTSLTFTGAHFVSARLRREDEYSLSRPPISLGTGAERPMHPLRTATLPALGTDDTDPEE